MIDHSGLKQMARAIGVRLSDLVPMDPANDPFLAGRRGRRIAAEWFAALFGELRLPKGVHLRRIHYRLISTPEPLRMPNGEDYQNTEKCWEYLINASRDARPSSSAMPASSAVALAMTVGQSHIRRSE